MLGEGSGVAAAGAVPEQDAAAAVAGREQFSIGTELDGGDPIRVLLCLVKYFSVRDRKDLDYFARAPERHQFAVGAYVGGEHDIHFIAERGQALAGADIE